MTPDAKKLAREIIFGLEYMKNRQIQVCIDSDVEFLAKAIESAYEQGGKDALKEAVKVAMDIGKSVAFAIQKLEKDLK